VTILIVEEAWRWREELRLLEGLHLQKFEVARKRHAAASYVLRVRPKLPARISA
jgi:hypothetical protein